MSLNYHLCKFIFNFPFIAEYHYEFSAFKFDSMKMGNILSNDQSNPRQYVQIVCFSQTRNPNQRPKISTPKIFINNNKKIQRKAMCLTLSTPALRIKFPFLFHLSANIGPLCWPKVLAKLPEKNNQMPLGKRPGTNAWNATMQKTPESYRLLSIS